jgi:hypothetical protein
MIDDDINYTNITNTYDPLLQRASVTNADPNASGTNGNTQQATVKSDGAMADVWIKNEIRSENWQPKKVGFRIDGQTGYAEFANVSISGEINALGGVIGGFTITADALIGKGGGIIETYFTDPLYSNTLAMSFTGNDLILFDNTTGGGGTYSGDSANIKFERTDDNTKGFIITKRAGKDFDADNVLEIYPPNQASSTRFNAWFNGRSGQDNAGNLGYFGITVDTRTNKEKVGSSGALNGRFEVRLSRNGQDSTNPAIIVYDARLMDQNDSLSGQRAFLIGEGANGQAGLAYYYNSTAFNRMIYVDGPTSLKLGATLNPDMNNSYDIGSDYYRIKDLYMSGNLRIGPAGSGSTGGGGLTADITSAGTSYFNGKLKIPVGTNLYA